MSGSIRLLPRDELVLTGPVDHADWNYRPLLGYIQRRRFALIVEALTQRHSSRLLEIGYGSGVFLPELAKHCDTLYAIDIHERGDDVGAALARCGVTAQLLTGSADDLAFDDDFFDCIVAVSSLEYVENIEAACTELRRVLSPDGRLVLVTPGHSWLVDLGLRVLTGESARENYAGRRHRLRRALADAFTEVQVRHFPRSGGSAVRLYTALCLAPRHSGPA